MVQRRLLLVIVFVCFASFWPGRQSPVAAQDVANNEADDLVQTFQLNLADEPIVSDGVPAPGAGNLERGGARDHYEFEGQQGQRIVLDLFQSFSQMVWGLYDPNEGQLYWGYAGDLVRTLPTTGTYRLEVAGNLPDNFGTYRFQIRIEPVQTFTLNVGDEPIVSDGVPAPGAGKLERGGARDHYEFEGQQGQRLVFDLFQPFSQMVWGLYDPNGGQLYWGYAGDLVRRLPTTGTYRLEVAGNLPDNFGTYRFQIRHEPIQTFSINIGDEVLQDTPEPGAGHLERGGARDHYLFEGDSGQRLVFDAQGATATIRWILNGPGGISVWNAGFSPFSGFNDRVITLPATGQYELEVYGSTLDTTATYRFQIREEPIQTFSINIGDEVLQDTPEVGAGHLERGGAIDEYEFAGNAGQEVRFDALFAPNSNFRWRLYDRFGNTLFDEVLADREYTLPQSGNYRLQVYNVIVDATGTYAFQIVDLDPVEPTPTPSPTATPFPYTTKIDLRLLDVNELPIGSDEPLEVGEEVRVDVYCEGIQGQTPAFGCFFDFQYDADAFDFVRLDYDDDYSLGRSATVIETTGLIDELGARSGSATPPADGRIVTVVLRVVQAGNTTLRTNAAESNPITLFGIDGDQREFTRYRERPVEILPECILGDANRDGVVNDEDAVFVLNRIGEFRSGLPRLETCADINADGAVTQTDTIRVINTILGQNGRFSDQLANEANEVQLQLQVVEEDAAPGMLVGESFALQLIFTDTSGDPAFSGYTDLRYDPAMVRFDRVTFDAKYPIEQSHGVDAEAGVIQQVGATTNQLSVEGLTDGHIATVHMTVLQSGPIVIQAAQADGVFRETVLYGIAQDLRSAMSYPQADLVANDPVTATPTATATATATPSATPTPTITPTPSITPTLEFFEPGDANQDGQLTPADAIFIRNRIGMSAEGLNHADMNENGIFDTEDVGLLLETINAQ